MENRVFYEDERLRVVGTGAVLFGVWRDAPQMAQMRSLARAGELHRDALPAGDKQAYINVVLDGTPNFSDEVRAEAALLARRAAGWRSATAHVVLVSGLRGLTVRTFMSTFLLLGRPAVPTKVFSAMEPAARWLLPLLRAPTWNEALLLATFRAAQTTR